MAAVACSSGTFTLQQLPTPNDTNTQRLTAATAIAIFAVMSLTMAFTSPGFLEGDACAHYLHARAAFYNAAYLTSVWGRPVCTGVYALPAHFFGRIGVRLTSLCLAIVAALVTQSIAKKQGWRWPVLGLIFLLAQPLVFLHSFSELTELPFAVLLTLGFWAYQRRLFLLFALVMGLGPLSRPEGFGFLGLALIALVLHRRWYWSIVLLLPLVLWDYAGWRLNGSVGHWWQWLQHSWPYSQDSLYQSGPLLYFISVMPAVTSPFIFPATVMGLFQCLTGESFTHARRERDTRLRPVMKDAEITGASNSNATTMDQRPMPRSNSLPAFGIGGWIREFFSTDHHRRCEILIVVLPMIILLGHSVLYWLGKMASNGEVRYMMVVAPFWALLGARGWGWIFQRLNWKRPLLWAMFAALLPVLVNRAWGVFPMDYTPDMHEAEQIAIWYQQSGIAKQYPHLLIAHVGLRYWLDLDPNSGQLIDWTKTNIDARPAGTLLIWDRVGAMFNSDAQRKVPLDEIRNAGWIPLKTRWTNGAGEWQFFESEPPHASADGRLIEKS
jgi:uncharacterized membrane protein